MKHVLPLSLLCGLLVAASPANGSQDHGVPSLGAVAPTASQVQATHSHGSQTNANQAPGAVAPNPIDPAQLTPSHISPYPVPPPSSSGGGVGIAGACDCTNGLPEGEANCGIPTDTVNGGCNYGPPYLFSPINLGDTYCGTVAFNGTLRDTDWYEIYLPQTETVTWEVTGNFDVLAGIIDGNNGCPATSFYVYDIGYGCNDTATVTATLSAGTWWFWAGPLFTNLLTCGESYTAKLYCNTAASATFRNDTGNTNPAGYVAAPPIMGTTWNASVDNSLTGNTFAHVVGYNTPLELYLAFLGDYLLVNIADPAGELLTLPATPGGGVVGFSATVPQDPVLCGYPFASQGYGFGGGIKPRLHNAYDCVVGGY